MKVIHGVPVVERKISRENGGYIPLMRAQLIQDLVQMGESEEWSELAEEGRPKCPTCGKALWARGEQTRYLQTTGGEAVKLTRTYGTCPTCGVGFFPSR